MARRVVSSPDFESNIPDSIPVVTTCWICHSVISRSNSSPTHANSQLVVALDLFETLVSVFTEPPTGTAVLNTLALKYSCY